MKELNVWFQEQKAHIESSGLSENEKKTQTLRLQKRFDDLMHRLIQGA